MTTKPKSKTITVRISEPHHRALGLLAEVEGRRLGRVLDEAATTYLAKADRAVRAAPAIQWPTEWDPNEGWPTDPALEEACVRLGKPRKPSGAAGGER